MFVRKLLIVCWWTILFSAALQARAQSCTTLGQTPATAFPVCGSSVFKQTSVPACANGIVPAPCPANGNIYEDLNPYWYKFTCFTSGTLGLTIRPNDLSDDYDWQLFDITGHNPSDVYSDASLVVACNWSGLTGVTGTTATAISYFECGSTRTPNFDPPIFSKMPQLIQGHNYLLMISHFSGSSQSGYGLGFSGGTASITDTVAPHLKNVQAVCDGSHIQVILNKNMQCSSLVGDGSDFTLNSPSVSIISATANCTGFDMDTLILTLSGALPPGNYLLSAAIGKDDNTLLDICGTQIPVGESMPLSIGPLLPTPLDSIAPPGCAPNVLKLVFTKKIACSSIAADGSDFTITGSYPVTVVGASGVCDLNDDGTAVILVKLSAPLVTAGNFRIFLAPGSDGNTLVDVCGQVTPPASLAFSIADTVNATFTDPIVYGCRYDTVQFQFPVKDGINKWQWTFNGVNSTSQQNPSNQVYLLVDSSMPETAQLIVSNGVCSDTAAGSVILNNYFKAKFEAPVIMCPKDFAHFQNNSIGTITGWDWEFGDGSNSPFQDPPDHLFAMTGEEVKYNAMLIASNNLGCKDTAVQQIDVLKTCYIAVPSAFTPNGDGLNDYLYPLNALKADNLIFRVFNRYGQMVFETNDWQKKWNGTVNGHPEPAGTFVWYLQYTDHDSGKKFFLKGTTILIR